MARTTAPQPSPQLQHASKPLRSIVRWPAALALLLIGVGYLLISDRLSVGPPWLLLVVVAVFLIPINITHYRGAFHYTRALVIVVVAFVTVVVVVSAVFLVTQLLGGGKTAAQLLLRDGAVIWLANMVAFSLWYWEIDAGGPAKRAMGPYRSNDLLFPQRSLSDTDYPDWMPEYVDYLFLAFNTSAAFSPTDTLILSRRIKGLMMLQSLISIVILAVLVARAINTLS